MRNSRVAHWDDLSPANKGKKGGRARKRIKLFHGRNCRKETIVGQSESLKHKKQNDQTFRKMR